MAKITFDTDAVLCELAGQYAAGMMTTDTYLDLMEEVCWKSVQPATEG